jgi:hypothetical protein
MLNNFARKFYLLPLLSATYKKLSKIVLKRFGWLGIKWEFCTPKRRERSCSEEKDVSFENKF